jgi:UDP-N-acetylmuramoylalanine--D-glutamate ligase
VVDEIQPEDLAVIELSSFQLELMSLSPNVAAVLNVTPNHLDRHGTMEAYLRAKAHILGYQKSGEFTILGRDDPGAWSLKDKINGNLLTFGLSQPGADKPGTFVTETELVLRWKGDYPGLYSEGASLMDHRLFPREEVLLRGDHNLLNVLAACAVGAAIGIPSGAMREGVRDFKGVPHRLQYVRNIGGADWYNDSIATAPERAMAAIRSFSEPLILLAGGRDKDLPWEDFAVLVQKRVDHLVVFGECANKILDAMSSLPNEIGRSMPGPTITVASDLRKAVEAAAQMAEPGDVILLSPGGTSFDEFSDFEERGECFVQLVMAL